GTNNLVLRVNGHTAGMLTNTTDGLSPNISQLFVLGAYKFLPFLQERRTGPGFAAEFALVSNETWTIEEELEAELDVSRVFNTLLPPDTTGTSYARFGEMEHRVSRDPGDTCVPGLDRDADG